MNIKIIADRLKEYKPLSQREELNALKEIIQEIALCALARAGFFEIAAFQGGSCLRIIHGMNRFSEDLDFMLRSEKAFVWDPFLRELRREFTMYGLDFQIIDRSKADSVIKTAFLKDTSFGKVLVLTHQRTVADKQTLQIKLEIDVNPPAGSKFETHYLDFPYTFSIVTQDLPSLFASKCHALLCRPFTKGRDWYDFIWYVSKKSRPNLAHLEAALKQLGPWQNQNIVMTEKWLIEALHVKIVAIDWQVAKSDIENFLRPHEREALKVWSSEFFLATLKKLEANLV